MKRKLELVIVADEPGGPYRAEVWVRPWSGQMISCTRWVTCRGTAVRDGKRYLIADVLHVKD